MTETKPANKTTRDAVDKALATGSELPSGISLNFYRADPVQVAKPAKPADAPKPGKAAAAQHDKTAAASESDTE